MGPEPASCHRTASGLPGRASEIAIDMRQEPDNVRGGFSSGPGFTQLGQCFEPTLVEVEDEEGCGRQERPEASWSSRYNLGSPCHLQDPRAGIEIRAREDPSIGE